MTWYYWTILCIPIYVIHAWVVYVSFLWFSWKKAKVEYRSWKDRTFTEWIYEGEGIASEKRILCIAMWVPLFGQVFFWGEYIDEYHKYIKNYKKKEQNSSPFHKILKVLTRKKYLLERVSKEI